MKSSDQECAEIGDAIATIVQSAVELDKTTVHILSAVEGDGRKRWFYFKENASNKKYLAAKMAVSAVGSAIKSQIGATAMSQAGASASKSGKGGQGSMANANTGWGNMHKQYAKKVSGNTADIMMWSKQTNDIQCFGIFDIIGSTRFEARIVVGTDTSGWSHFLEIMESDPLADVSTQVSGTILRGSKQLTVTGHSPVTYG